MGDARGVTEAAGATPEAVPENGPSALARAVVDAPVSAREASELHTQALGRLASDGARREYVRRLGVHGNRHVARVLARRVSADALKQIATGAKSKKGDHHAFESMHLAWELVNSYCPEKGFALSGSRYSAGQKGGALDGTTLVVGDDIVDRVAAGDADTVGKELKSLLAKLPDPFGTLAKGGVGEATAPEILAIPLALDVAMDKAWSKSFPKGKSQEQGGVLVTDKKGEYVFHPGQAGTSGAFTPNRGSVKKNEKLVSIAHTHPYDKSEGGFTDVAFSGQDIALMAISPEKMSFVRSGDHDFLMARTTEFDALVKKAKNKDKLFREIRKHWTDLFKGGTGSLPERARAATRATCLKYHLLLYEGDKGVLRQPQEMLAAHPKKP